MSIEIQHSETKEIVSVEMVASNGTWLLAKDGYTYDMRHWRKVDR